MSVVRLRTGRIFLLAGGVCMLGQVGALAGPYSTGLGNTTSGAPDAAIPGFVGPLGEGRLGAGQSVNPIFKEWASAVANYSPAPGVDANWSDSARALGPVTGDQFHIVSLGDLSATQLNNGVPPGSITLTFPTGIRNGSGHDFAVFENSFGSQTSVFIELAYVEVSTDGTNFARFPSVSLNTTSPGAFGNMNPTNLYNLAGKHVNNQGGGGNSWGTPFDLSDLLNHTLVLGGQVNLNNIQYVRMVDIPGNGTYTDSLGNPIIDAWQTTGSGGLDLEAVGVINVVPEPTSLLALAVGSGAVMLRRRVSSNS